MPNSSKRFRLLRSSSDKSEPSKAQSEPVEPAAPKSVEERIGAAVRSRVANSRQEPQTAPMVENVEDDDSADFGHDREYSAPIEEEGPLSPREEIAQIKQENLTGRQLRIARRVAQKNGLQPTSDLDAVRLLRKRGIDPFNRGEIAEVMGAGGGSGPVTLPATVRKTQVAEPRPQPQVIDDDTREREIKKIQKDLVTRRRKRLGVLFVKLACFIALPSMIAGYYFYQVATPMYATYTQFIIQKADAPGAAGGGLLSKTPFANVTDSIAVQGYLTSRDSMLRLDENPGFRGLFQDPSVDVLQRLAPDATNEDAYGIYEDKVVIGFDPTEGVIKMEVIAPSPESSLSISKALIGYAEEQVDQLTQRLRGDQMVGAEGNYAEAERKMTEAQDRVANLQRQLNTFDPGAAFQLVMNQIAGLDDQILQKQLELAQLQDNARPNQTKLRVLQREIELLQLKLEEKQALVTQGNDETNSIVNINAELSKAMNDLELRQSLLAVGLENLESARVEANRQTRYLSLGVAPVLPDKATYPRAFENTLLSIVIFAGIYLMISLTVSILREQVTT